MRFLWQSDTVVQDRKMMGAVMSVLLKESCKGDGTANETMLHAAESMIEAPAFLRFCDIINCIKPNMDYQKHTKQLCIKCGAA